MSLTRGEALTRVRVSAAKAERFAEFYTGEGADPLSHDSFCRQVFRSSHAGRAVDPAQALPCDYVAVADASHTFDFSGFRQLPFHVQRWLTVDLIAPQDGEYAFRLGTCGGVRVWCSGRLIASFTPFTRNEMQFLNMQFPLRAGQNRLIIHLEELFERDTFCGLKIIYQDEAPLSVVACEGPELPQIPAQPEPDPQLYSLLKRVSAREEGSVYCLLTLLQLWQDQRNEHFPPALRRRVKSTILGYRYWDDERGCDVMDFAGHARAFHTAQRLAGELFPDARFIASSRFGHQQQALAEKRMTGVQA